MKFGKVCSLNGRTLLDVSEVSHVVSGGCRIGSRCYNGVSTTTTKENMRKGGISGNWSLKRTRDYIAKIMDPKTQRIEKVSEGYVFIDDFQGLSHFGKTPRKAIQNYNPLLMSDNCFCYGID